MLFDKLLFESRLQGEEFVYRLELIKRFLQKQVETQLARALVAGEVEDGSEVTFTIQEDRLKMTVS